MTEQIEVSLDAGEVRSSERQVASVEVHAGSVDVHDNGKVQHLKEGKTYKAKGSVGVSVRALTPARFTVTFGDYALNAKEA